jgi:hypothetical protein
MSIPAEALAFIVEVVFGLLLPVPGSFQRNLVLPRSHGGKNAVLADFQFGLLDVSRG